MMPRGYVVDASVALKWFLDERAEPDAGLAIDLIGNCALKTTSLCVFEVGNTLNRFSRNDADRIVEALEELRQICGEPIGLESDDFHRCAKLADTHSLTFYDASYVAIAERLGRRVVSADRDLLEPGLAVDLGSAVAAG